MSNEYEQCHLNITFDVETTGLNPRVDELKLVCFAQGSQKASLRHPQQRKEIQEWLDRDAYFFAHNSTFDWSFLDHNGYKLPPPKKWRDTQIAAHLAGFRMPGSLALDKLQKHYVKEGVLPAWILEPEVNLKKWLAKARREAKKNGLPRPEKGHAPMHILEPYCMSDVESTQFVGQMCGKQLEGQEKVLDIEHRVIPAIFHTQKRGAPIDLKAAKRFQKHVETEFKRYEKQVRELAIIPDFNPNAARQIEDALRLRGVDVDSLPKTEKSKQPKMDAATLATIADDLPKALLKMREQKKMIDYAAGFFKYSHEGRLYGTFRQVGTGTGRMSSGEPNLQNLPTDKRVRSIISTDDPYILVGSDYDNMELRMMGHLAPGGAIEKAFKEGLDLHQITADGVGFTRQQAKTLNYSILFGVGVAKTAQTFGISFEEARVVLERWHRTYPEVNALKDEIRWDLKTVGYVQTVGGRRHYLNPDQDYIALNYLIQGGCADIFKEAAARIHEAGLRAILYVHDEIVLEALQDEAEDARVRLEQIMMEASGDANLLAEASIGMKWSDLK